MRRVDDTEWNMIIAVSTRYIMLSLFEMSVAAIILWFSVMHFKREILYIL